MIIFYLCCGFVAVELSKLERRKWQPKWNPAIENTKTVALDLPVPSTSPAVLNESHDYQIKTNFFRILGLESISTAFSNGESPRKGELHN